MRLTYIFSLFLIFLLFPFTATARSDAPPNGFLSTDEITDLLSFENFDDFHSLEDEGGNRIKPLHENIPTLAESYKDGTYRHYDEEGVTDTAEYAVKDHALCLTWTWSNNEDFAASIGVEQCFYIQQLGNCYLPHTKSRWARRDREIKTRTFLFVKYGDAANCTPKVS